MSRRVRPAPDLQETVRRATREEALKSVTMGIKLSPKGSSLTWRIAREPVFGQVGRPFTIR